LRVCCCACVRSTACVNFALKFIVASWIIALNCCPIAGEILYTNCCPIVTAIKEQHLALEQEKVRLKKDREIMSMDITGMDEQQQQYYKLLRSQIIARNSSI
jgi:hypothetical protein